MTRYDFIRELALRSNITQSNARTIAKNMGEIIAEHINDEDGISPFTGIKFYSSYKEERQMRNPITKTISTVKPKYYPRVKFSAVFKNLIN